MSFKSIAEFQALTGPDAHTEGEKDLITATQAGDACYLCDPDNPSLPSTSSDKTRIRAALLRLLITGGSTECGLHTRGVTLFGGWIDGELDLAWCKARGQTVLDFCHFEERPRLEGARFKLLSLDGSAFPNGLFAQGAQVQGDLFLSSTTSSGTVDVGGAKVGGQLACIDARVDGGKDEEGAQQTALNAQGVETGQDLFLSNFTAIGTVDVSGAKIGGQLSCNGAQFDGGKDKDGAQQWALRAQGVETRHDHFLSSITAIGTVDVNGAKIGGQLACDGAQFDGGKDKDGAQQWALNAQRMRVTAGFVFRNVKMVKGQINLTAAHVSDLVDDVDSWPLAPDELILDGLTYDRTDGPTTFAARQDWLRAGSHLWGDFYPQPYSQLARVLRQMGHAGEARKMLMDAALVEAKTFQKQHRARRRFARAVRLFSRTPSDTGQQAIEWSLGKLPQSLQFEATETHGLWQRYHRPLPTPAEAPAQLDLVTLSFAQQDFRNRLWCRAFGSRMAILGSRIKHSFLSHIVGHGHAPQRAITAILASTVFAAFWYGYAYREGALVPNSDVILTSFNWWWSMQDQALAPTDGWTATGTAQHYETFYALAYAFDVIVPLVDLGQDSAWSSTTVTWTGWWTRVLTMALEVWGWIVTALGAAAVTGLVQRNQPD